MADDSVEAIVRDMQDFLNNDVTPSRFTIGNWADRLEALSEPSEQAGLDQAEPTENDNSPLWRVELFVSEDAYTALKEYATSPYICAEIVSAGLAGGPSPTEEAS